jgi:hypothetical protein
MPEKNAPIVSRQAHRRAVRVDGLPIETGHTQAGVLSEVNMPRVPIGGTPGIGTFTDAAGATAGISCDHRLAMPSGVTASAFHVAGTLLSIVKPRVSVLCEYVNARALRQTIDPT